MTTDASWIDGLRSGDLLGTRQRLSWSRNVGDSFDVAAGIPILLLWIRKLPGDQVAFSCILNDEMFSSSLPITQFSKAFELSARYGDGV